MVYPLGTDGKPIGYCVGKNVTQTLPRSMNSHVNTSTFRVTCPGSLTCKFCAKREMFQTMVISQASGGAPHSYSVGTNGAPTLPRKVTSDFHGDPPKAHVSYPGSVVATVTQGTDNSLRAFNAAMGYCVGTNGAPTLPRNLTSDFHEDPPKFPVLYPGSVAATVTQGTVNSSRASNAAKGYSAGTNLMPTFLKSMKYDFPGAPPKYRYPVKLASNARTEEQIGRPAHQQGAKRMIRTMAIRRASGNVQRSFGVGTNGAPVHQRKRTADSLGDPPKTVVMYPESITTRVTRDGRRVLCCRYPDGAMLYRDIVRSNIKKVYKWPTKSKKLVASGSHLVGSWSTHQGAPFSYRDAMDTNNSNLLMPPSSHVHGIGQNELTVPTKNRDQGTALIPRNSDGKRGAPQHPQMKRPMFPQTSSVNFTSVTNGGQWNKSNAKDNLHRQYNTGSFPRSASSTGNIATNSNASQVLLPASAEISGPEVKHSNSNEFDALQETLGAYFQRIQKEKGTFNNLNLRVEFDKLRKSSDPAVPSEEQAKVVEAKTVEKEKKTNSASSHQKPSSRSLEQQFPLDTHSGKEKVQLKVDGNGCVEGQGLDNGCDNGQGLDKATVTETSTSNSATIDDLDLDDRDHFDLDLDDREHSPVPMRAQECNMDELVSRTVSPVGTDAVLQEVQGYDEQIDHIKKQAPEVTSVEQVQFDAPLPLPDGAVIPAPCVSTLVEQEDLKLCASQPLVQEMDKENVENVDEDVAEKKNESTEEGLGSNPNTENWRIRAATSSEVDYEISPNEPNSRAEQPLVQKMGKENVENVDTEVADETNDKADEGLGSNPNTEKWKIRAATALGKDYEISPDEPNSRAVIIELFQMLLGPVLKKIDIQLPEKWNEITEEGVTAFLNEYNEKVDEYKLKNSKQPLLSTENWRQKDSTFMEIIIRLAYRLAIPNENVLNYHYKAFSSEVYGETHIPQIQVILNELKLGENDVFLDLGCGVGQLVLFAAGFLNLKKSVGIEINKVPFNFALAIKKHFERLLAHFGVKSSESELLKGDFTAEENQHLINKEATVIFINNFAFDEELTAKLKETLMKCKDGTRIITTKQLRHLRRNNYNAADDFGNVSNAEKLTSLAGGVSWTHTKIDFELVVMDRENKEQLQKELEKQEKENEKTKKTKGNKRNFKGDGDGGPKSKKTNTC